MVVRNKIIYNQHNMYKKYYDDKLKKIEEELGKEPGVAVKETIAREVRRKTSELKHFFSYGFSVFEYFLQEDFSKIEDNPKFKALDCYFGLTCNGSRTKYPTDAEGKPSPRTILREIDIYMVRENIKFTLLQSIHRAWRKRTSFNLEYLIKDMSAPMKRMLLRNVLVLVRNTTLIDHESLDLDDGDIDDILGRLIPTIITKLSEGELIQFGLTKYNESNKNIEFNILRNIEHSAIEQLKNCHWVEVGSRTDPNDMRDIFGFHDICFESFETKERTFIYVEIKEKHPTSITRGYSSPEYSDFTRDTTTKGGKIVPSIHLKYDGVWHEKITLKMDNHPFVYMPILSIPRAELTASNISLYHKYLEFKSIFYTELLKNRVRPKKDSNEDVLRMYSVNLRAELAAIEGSLTVCITSFIKKRDNANENEIENLRLDLLNKCNMLTNDVGEFINNFQFDPLDLESSRKSSLKNITGKLLTFEQIELNTQSIALNPNEAKSDNNNFRIKISNIIKEATSLKHNINHAKMYAIDTFESKESEFNELSSENKKLKKRIKDLESKQVASSGYDSRHSLIRTSVAAKLKDLSKELNSNYVDKIDRALQRAGIDTLSEYDKKGKKAKASNKTIKADLMNKLDQLKEYVDELFQEGLRQVEQNKPLEERDMKYIGIADLINDFIGYMKIDKEVNGKNISTFFKKSKDIKKEKITFIIIA